MILTPSRNIVIPSRWQHDPHIQRSRTLQTLRAPQHVLPRWAPNAPLLNAAGFQVQPGGKVSVGLGGKIIVADGEVGCCNCRIFQCVKCFPGRYPRSLSLEFSDVLLATGTLHTSSVLPAIGPNFGTLAHYGNQGYNKWTVSGLLNSEAVGQFHIRRVRHFDNFELPYDTSCFYSGNFPGLFSVTATKTDGDTTLSYTGPADLLLQAVMGEVFIDGEGYAGAIFIYAYLAPVIPELNPTTCTLNIFSGAHAFTEDGIGGSGTRIFDCKRASTVENAIRAVDVDDGFSQAGYEGTCNVYPDNTDATFIETPCLPWFLPMDEPPFAYQLPARPDNRPSPIAFDITWLDHDDEEQTIRLNRESSPYLVGTIESSGYATDEWVDDVGTNAAQFELAPIAWSPYNNTLSSNLPVQIQASFCFAGSEFYVTESRVAILRLKAVGDGGDTFTSVVDEDGQLTGSWTPIGSLGYAAQDGATDLGSIVSFDPVYA